MFMGRQLKIAVDIDDVQADFINPLMGYFSKRLGKVITKKDVTSYHFSRNFGLSSAESEMIVGGFIESPDFDNLPVIDGAASAMKFLAENHNVVTLTARSERLRDRTLNWLSRNVPANTREVYFSQNHYVDWGVGSMTKGEYCVGNGIDVFVEDSVDYAQQCNRNTFVLLFDQPWNRDLGNDNMRKRVYSWGEILGFVDSVSRDKIVLPFS